MMNLSLSILQILDEPFLLTYLLVICTTVATIIFEYKKHAALFKKGAIKRISGPFGIPLLGNIYQLTMAGRKKRLEGYTNLYFKWAHLGLARFTFLNYLFVLVFAPEYLEMILGNVKTAKKPKEYKILYNSPLGGGLISQPDVNVWRAHRKIITPTFHFNVLKTYIPVFYEETTNFITNLKEKLIRANKSSDNIVVPDMRPFVQLSAFDMILRNAFGVNIQAQKNNSHSFVSAMSEATNVLEEIDSIFGGPNGDDEHIPTYSEIMDLHTLDRVIKETMRLYPAAPIIGRAITKDMPIGPFILPKGSDVGILIIALHRDPSLHPKADKFWPDRFLPDNSHLIKNFSYLPFSAGSRNCVGQKYAMLQMKVLLSTILRKYRLDTDERIRCLKDVDDLIDLSVTLNIERCPLILTPRSRDTESLNVV